MPVLLIIGIFLLGLAMTAGTTALLAWGFAFALGTPFLTTWLAVFLVVALIRYATSTPASN